MPFQSAALVHPPWKERAYKSLAHACRLVSYIAPLGPAQQGYAFVSSSSSFFCCTLDSRYRYFATLKLKLWSVRKQLSNVLFSVISSVIDSHRIERSYKDQLRDIFIVCEFSFLFNRHTRLTLWYGWCSYDRRNNFLLILGVHPHG